MKHVFNAKLTQFYQGLPANDLDDADLNDEQKALLAHGVEKGLYAPVQPVGKKGKADVVQPSAPSAENSTEGAA